MEQLSELASSLEFSKEWEVKWPTSAYYSGYRTLTSLFQQESQWIQTPWFTLPLLEGSWTVALVPGRQLVYVKQDGMLALQQSGQQQNSGVQQIVLIHLYAKGRAAVYPEKKLKFYASISKGSSNQQVFKKELAAASNSFQDQAIWNILVDNYNFGSYQNAQRIVLKVTAILETWQQENSGAAAAKPAGLLENNNKLIDMLLSPAVSDVTFVFKDQQKIFAHQSALAESSPVFAAMFATKMKESETRTVKIEDASTDAFRHFIRYFYANHIDQVPLKAHVAELLYLSDKYNLAALKNDCNRHLLSTPLQIHNCISLYTTADRFQLDELKTKAFDFMKNNSKELTKSRQWQILMRDKHELALELAVRMLQEQENEDPTPRSLGKLYRKKLSTPA